jgi:environmental stress-induced protein Ves
MKIIRYASLTATPWKNGGGMTYELIRVPPGRGPFRWRLSVAHIDAPGPFSDFAGYDRTMILLRGAGVRLTFDGGSRQELRGVGDMAQFDGGCATQCELLQGSCADLNLIVSQSIAGVRAWVEPVAGPRPFPSHATLLAFPLSGAMCVDAGSGDGTAILQPWDLAVASRPDRLTISRASRGEPAAGAVSVDAGSGGTATLQPWDLAVASRPDPLAVSRAPPVESAARLVFFAALDDNPG